MIQQFYALRRAFERCTQPAPTNLSEAIRALPPIEVLPSLWTTWLFISLLVFRERQRWAKVFVHEHLPEAFPPGRLFQTAQGGDEFALPGAPEWRICLECGWGFGDLIHRETREWITFDLTGENTEPIIYVWLFDRHTRPTSRWQPAGRLLELHRSFEAMIGHAIEDLVAVRYLAPINDDGSDADPDMQPDGYRLEHQIADRYAPHIQRFCNRWEQATDRLWLAALIGDWLLAHELAQNTGDAELITVTGQLATQCQRLRDETLRLASINRSWNKETLSQMTARDAKDLVGAGR
jgi:hypothetical protein